MARANLKTMLMASTVMFVAATPGLAADFTISVPTFDQNGGLGNVINGHDTFTITSTGSIVTSGDNILGVYAEGTDNTISNYGLIETNGDFAPGILSLTHGYDNEDNVITNGADAEIYAGGFVSPGIAIIGYDGGEASHNEVTNDGFIGAGGLLSSGIVVVSADLDSNIGDDPYPPLGEENITDAIAGDNTITNTGDIIAPPPERALLEILVGHRRAGAELLGLACRRLRNLG